MERLVPASKFNFGKKPYASRLYANHIHVMSNKFANWEPSIEIKVPSCPILLLYC